MAKQREPEKGELFQSKSDELIRIQTIIKPDYGEHAGKTMVEYEYIQPNGELVMRKAEQKFGPGYYYSHWLEISRFWRWAKPLNKRWRLE